MYSVELARKAAKFYQRIDPPTARRLNLIFDHLSKSPFDLPNTKQLKGELSGSFRIRMGDIRIIYSVNEADKTVYIEVIGFRGDVYKA